MKKNMEYYSFLIITISIIFLFIGSLNIYGDDTQKLDREKKQPPPSVSADKVKNTNTNVEAEKTEQKTSKKKVPAFWFLLPEK